MREEIQVLKRELSIALDRIKELEEENGLLKEENQQLRLAHYGIKSSRKKGKKGSKKSYEGEPKKLGPPKGHKGTSRRRAERVDRTVVLKLEECSAEIFGLEYARIKRDMRELNCHYDDTGQRVNGENNPLWVFIANANSLSHKQ